MQHSTDTEVLLNTWFMLRPEQHALLECQIRDGNADFGGILPWLPKRDPAFDLQPDLPEVE